MIIVNEIRYLAKGDEWGSDGDIRTMAFGQQIEAERGTRVASVLPQVAEASSPR